MSRRRKSIKKNIIPDYKYNNLLIGKFINIIMRDGKKSLAEKIVYRALSLIRERTKSEEMLIFKKAIDNIKPSVEVKSRRIGGASYQVPIEVNSDRAMTLAFRWLKNASVKRNEKSMAMKLACEVIDALNGKGASFKQKENVHKMAEANRAFSHYKW